MPTTINSQQLEEEADQETKKSRLNMKKVRKKSRREKDSSEIKEYVLMENSPSPRIPKKHQLHFGSLPPGKTPKIVRPRLRIFSAKICDLHRVQMSLKRGLF